MEAPAPAGESPRRRIVSIVVIAVIMGAFLGLLGYGLTSREAPTGRSGITRVGKEAPAFDLPTLAGSQLALADLRGAPAVLNFWASWCPPCRAELPLLEQTATAQAANGIRFVGVNIQDTEPAARSTIRTYGVTYENVHDASGRIAIDYGVVGLPVTFFVDPDGVVVRRHVGALSASVLNAALQELFTGESSNTETTNEGEFYEF